MVIEKLSAGKRVRSTGEQVGTPAHENSNPKSVSVYLSNKDKQTLDEITKENNVNRHMLLSYAVRYFLANYRAGHIKLDPTIEAGKVVLNVNLDLNDK